MNEPLPEQCALPLSSLRLLVSPLQLMSAALWGIVQHRAVRHYGLLEDFITALHDTIPGVLTQRERVHISLGLRAKVVLEMCNSDDLCYRQNLEPHLKKMEDLIMELADEESKSKMNASFAIFSKVIYSLLDDPNEKDMFYQKMFTSEFDFKFDSSMQTLVRKLILHLENLLPVPSLDQTSLWLGLCPSVLKECEDILNETESLNDLIQHHKHNYTFSTDLQTESKATHLQSSDTQGDEPQAVTVRTKEDVPSVEVSLSYDVDDDEEYYSTDVPHAYQRELVGKKSFRCPICGLNFDDLSLLSKHSISGCSGECIRENTITQVILDSDTLREETQHVSIDSDAVPKYNVYSDDIVCLLCGQVYTHKTLLEHQKVCVVRYEQEKRAAATKNVTRKHRDQDLRQCVVVLKRVYSTSELSKDKTIIFSSEKFSQNSFSKASVQRCVPPQNLKMPAIKSNLYSILIQPCNLNSCISSITKNNTGIDSGPQRESENSTFTKSMKCTLCDQTFSKILIMKRHYFNVHRVKGSYQCPSCKRSFVRLCDMVKHHQNIRLLECDTCKRCFTKLNVLKKHKAQYNNTCATPHVCETCGKECLNAGVLKHHQNVHRDKMTELSVLIVVKSSVQSLVFVYI
ncbi:zinc finger and SCAN domain-containing protein 12-like isoform X2 [Boleophthalmus pectinirostris]|uniref:zinc finger and SCAN domain-containing protein 12-like isoform X2 n=1 Tax=Boleophthalmus pectinirostris TaxID=150288 RepID=UPI00242DB9E8|nr:zinc finger and SCAN domain-containing protein 12-like isoform X2 [Boleophthalmus pectinirostris]